MADSDLDSSVFDNTPIDTQPSVARLFTPGPWHVGYVDGNGQSVVLGEHVEICTCWHHSIGSIEREMRGNAKLIAAAPTLYAALAEMRRQFTWGNPDQRHALKFADMALSKARGEIP